MKGNHPSFGLGTPFSSKNFPFDKSEKKYNEYLLNKSHSEGKSKAEYIETHFGYSTGDAKAFHNAISDAINGKYPTAIEKTKYGVKQNFDVKLKAKDGTYKDAKLVAVLQNDNGVKYWRIITVKPGKKDK